MTTAATALRAIASAILVFASIWASASAATPDEPKAQRSPILQTSHGPVQGRQADGMREYLGIRYAAPPTGEDRWRAPQPPETWSKAKDATQFGNRCAQTLTLITFAEKSGEEDCLFLNVYTPANDASADLPVMVWLHGGGLVDGESDDYDPRPLVEKGEVIVVTLNYRLNAFGFLALPGLDASQQPAANYGLLDQQFALEWVQSNISRFGGDPNNVTLFGESAGALSVLANMASPSAEGLFQRAIIESPARGQKLRLTQPSLNEARTRSLAFAKAVGCETDVAACLRDRPVSDLQPAAEQFSSTFVVDGKTLPLPLGEAFTSGRFNQVPIIIGSNKDEGRFSVAYKELTADEALTPPAFSDSMAEAYGEDAVSVIGKQYPLSDYNDPSVALAAVLTDSRISCPVDALNQRLAGQIPVYAYEFADRTAPFYFPNVSFPYGAAHTAELQYLFERFHGASGEPQALNALQRSLSDTMIDYWTRFAATGNPNTPATPDWKRYTAAQGDYQRLKLPAPYGMSREAYRKSHRCGFWSAQ